MIRRGFSALAAAALAAALSASTPAPARAQQAGGGRDAHAGHSHAAAAGGAAMHPDAPPGLQGTLPPLRGERPPIPHTSTELVRVEHHPETRVVEVVLGPFELRDGMPHLRAPIQMVEMPVGGWLQGYGWEITDPEGQRLPDRLLHHVNFVDPDHRQLFDPTARRVLAAGRETREATLPPVVGIPFEAGTRYMVSAMFANSTGRDYPEAYLHVDLHYLRSGDKLVHPRDVYPFYLDVTGPVGLKDFEVPPGRTVRAWEGSPAVDARILGVGGHLHDYARELRLIDLTTGEVLWRTEPNASASGRVYSVPMGKLWWEGGVPIHADHRYRAEVVYFNPTDSPAPLGGMGVIAGVVTPARGAVWPEIDRSDPAYRTNLLSHVTAPDRLSGHGHAMSGMQEEHGH